MQPRNHRVSPQPVRKCSSQAKGEAVQTDRSLRCWGWWSKGLAREVCLCAHHCEHTIQRHNLNMETFQIKASEGSFWLTDEILRFAIMGCFGILGKWAHACKKDFQSLSFMLQSSMLRAELQKLGPSIPAFKQLICFGGAEPDCTYQWNSIIRVIKYPSGN